MIRKFLTAYALGLALIYAPLCEAVPFGFWKGASGSTNPFPTANLGEWWDSNMGLVVSGSNPTTWTDQVSGKVLTAVATTSPMNVVLVGSRNYIQFSTSGAGGYFTMPAGLTWSQQAVSWYFFFKDRSGNTNNNAFFFGNTNPDAMFLAGQELKRYDTNGINTSGLFVGDNMTAVFVRVQGATNTLVGTGAQVATLGAQSSGTQNTGGNVAEWASPPQFPIQEGSLVGILKYDAFVSPTTHAAILAAGAALYGSAPSSNTGYCVFDGDSRTFGVGSTNSEYYSFPYQMGQLYSGGQPTFSISAVGGLTAQANTAATATISQLGFFTWPAKYTAFYDIGINDLDAGSTATQIEGWITTWVTNVRAAKSGIKIVLGTVFDSSELSGPDETQRALLNTWILGGTSGADFVVDFAGDARLQTPTDLTYFNADGLHLNNNGYSVCASLAKTVFDAHTLLP